MLILLVEYIFLTTFYGICYQLSYPGLNSTMELVVTCTLNKLFPLLLRNLYLPYLQGVLLSWGIKVQDLFLGY